MFNIPLSDESDGPQQKHPPMICKLTGPGYPKDELVANRETRCELCAQVVLHQFSWCELPCPRAGTSPVGWQVCIFCGTMRCDPLPVVVELDGEGNPIEPPRPPPPLQQCACTYKGGEQAWAATQDMIKSCNERGSWCHQE